MNARSTDAISNYSITTANGITTIVNVGDSAHRGTLNVGNVQESSLDSERRSQMAIGGTLEAFAGSSVVILGPLPNTSEPAQIDNGAFLNISTASRRTVSFNGAGTLQIDPAGTFSGSDCRVLPSET